ncbi:MAG: AzlD domain-containing protein [Coprococcus sp.]
MTKATGSVLVIGLLLGQVLPIDFTVFKKRQMPAFLKEIADKLPPAIIAVLVIYCLKGPLTVLGTETIAAIIAIAGVVILHLWKRNMLLSVAAGTVLYMIFIRCLP